MCINPRAALLGEDLTARGKMLCKHPSVNGRWEKLPLWTGCFNIIQYFWLLVSLAPCCIFGTGQWWKLTIFSSRWCWSGLPCTSGLILNYLKSDTEPGLGCSSPLHPQTSFSHGKVISDFAEMRSLIINNTLLNLKTSSVELWGFF